MPISFPVYHAARYARERQDTLGSRILLTIVDKDRREALRERGVLDLSGEGLLPAKSTRAGGRNQIWAPPPRRRKRSRRRRSSRRPSASGRARILWRFDLSKRLYFELHLRRRRGAGSCVALALLRREPRARRARGLQEEGVRLRRGRVGSPARDGVGVGRRVRRGPHGTNSFTVTQKHINASSPPAPPPRPPPAATRSPATRSAGRAARASQTRRPPRTARRTRCRRSAHLGAGDSNRPFRRAT
jgi:hypothetical protein